MPGKEASQQEKKPSHLAWFYNIWTLLSCNFSTAKLKKSRMTKSSKSRKNYDFVDLLSLSLILIALPCFPRR